MHYVHIPFVRRGRGKVWVMVRCREARKMFACEMAGIRQLRIFRCFNLKVNKFKAKKNL